MTTESKHLISLEQAQKMTATYRKNKKELIGDAYRSKDPLPICETFERSAFDQILAQPGCTGVRAYYAMDDNGSVHLIFVGVNEKNEDMIEAPQQTTTTMRTTAASTTSGGGVLVENGSKCPTDCPPSSTLNGGIQ
jgi:hypothetical protein